ncbi:hypothetical protein ABC733_18945 [Mangrovibacter sp. SLW1]
MTIDIQSLVSSSLQSQKEEQDLRDKNVQRRQDSLKLKAKMASLHQQASYYESVIRGKLMNQPSIYGSQIAEAINQIVIEILKVEQPQLMNSIERVKQEILNNGNS